MSEFPIDRVELLVILNKLRVANSDYNASVIFKSIGDSTAIYTFNDGVMAVEIVNIDLPLKNEPLVVALDPLYSFVQASTDTKLKFKINPKTLRVTDTYGSGTYQKNTVYLDVSLPRDDDIICELSNSIFSDITRVGNISEGKNSARPILGGVLFVVEDGIIRSLAANGVSFGYAWEQDKNITVHKPEKILVRSDSLVIVQKYDFNSQTVKVFRPRSDESTPFNMGSSKAKIVFASDQSFLFLSELADKDRYPDKFVFDAAADTKGKHWFEVDSSLFKSYISTAIKLSTYEDRVVTVSLLNGRVFVSSGRRTKQEVEESDQEYVGFSKFLECKNNGNDFVFAINQKFISQVISLLEQVDKGFVRVTKGEETELIFFSTPAANAIYGVAPMHR